MVFNQELEEEGGDADDGEHQEVRDEEGAASVLKNETLDSNKFNGDYSIQESTLIEVWLAPCNRGRGTSTRCRGQPRSQELTAGNQACLTTCPW